MALNGSYRYPRKRIDDNDDYLRILIVDYVPPGLGAETETDIIQRTATKALEDSGNLKNPLYQILLPMPQGISDNNMVSWGDDSLNPLAATAVQAAGTAIKGDLGGAITTLLSQMKNLTTSGNAQDAVTAYASAMAVNNFGANVSGESLLTRSSGQVINPNMELLFKGVQLRSFNFSFNLAPRDKNESREVKNIIRTFKKSMAARSSSGAGAGLFISSPNIFQLEYRSGNIKHPFLHSFKPCALLNMGVDYTGSGSYATYEDATPVHMKLNLSFQEINPVYFSDYKDEKDLTDADGVEY
jgi:hypothetical protein